MNYIHNDFQSFISLIEPYAEPIAKTCATAASMLVIHQLAIYAFKRMGVEDQNLQFTAVLLSTAVTMGSTLCLGMSELEVLIGLAVGAVAIAILEMAKRRQQQPEHIQQPVTVVPPQEIQQTATSPTPQTLPVSETSTLQSEQPPVNQKPKKKQVSVPKPIKSNVEKQNHCLAAIKTNSDNPTAYRELAATLKDGQRIEIEQNGQVESMDRNEILTEAHKWELVGVIHENPDNFIAYCELANLLSGTKSRVQLKDETAPITRQQLCQKAIERAPENPENAWAYLHFAKDLPTQSTSVKIKGIEKPLNRRELYERAVVLSSKDSKILASTYIFLGHEVPSGTQQSSKPGEMTRRQYYQTAIDLEPQNSYVYSAIALGLNDRETFELKIDGKKMKINKKGLFTKALSINQGNIQAIDWFAPLNAGERKKLIVNGHEVILTKL